MTVLSYAKDEAEALIDADPQLKNQPTLLAQVLKIMESKTATMN